MVTPEDRVPQYVYDFVLCFSIEDLKQSLEIINYHGFTLVAVTETNTKYTVFFRRPKP